MCTSLFHDESRRLTCQVVRLDDGLFGGYGVDLGHAFRREYAPALELPVFVLLQKHCAHQSLEQVGALDLLPALGREVAEGHHVLAGLDHQLSRAGELSSDLLLDQLMLVEVVLRPGSRACPPPATA